MLNQTYSFSPKRWALFCACVAVLVLVAYFRLDLPLTQLLNAERTPWVHDIFDVIDELGTSEYYLVPALLAYGYGLYRLSAMGGAAAASGRLRAERMARGGLFVIVTLAAGGAIVALLKAGVARARPELLIDHGIYGLGIPFMRVEDYNSFPSSHTFSAFGVAATLAILFPRIRWPLMIDATGVAMARVINLDNYFSDVVVSATLALVLAAFMAPLVLDARHEWPLRSPWRWFARRR